MSGMIEVASVDTMILIYGVRGEQPKDTDQTRRLCRSAAHLLRRIRRPHVSAVTWNEYIRGARPDEEAKTEALRARLRIDSVDGRVADRAAALMRAYRRSERVCAKCHTAKAAAVCAVCGLRRGTPQRLDDALVAATADVWKRDALFTFDGGMFDFQPGMKTSVIREPEDPNGPLFDRSRKSSR